MTIIEKEMAQYPETGIINPFVNTKFVFTQEMLNFFNGFLLVYRDYPDAKITGEFAEKFEIDITAAKDIEHAYVVVNRARILKRIEKLFMLGKSMEEIVKCLAVDFGLDEINAEKYVRRCSMDRIDYMAGTFVNEKK